MNIYHPLRIMGEDPYKQMREEPLTRRYVLEICALYDQVSLGNATMAQLDAMVKDYFPTILYHESPEFKKPDLMMMMLARAHNAFCAMGKHIFSFSPVLIQSLMHTDFIEPLMSNARPPYNCLYLHFGSNGLRDYDRVTSIPIMLEGAYVSFIVDDRGYFTHICPVMTKADSLLDTSYDSVIGAFRFAQRDDFNLWAAFQDMLKMSDDPNTSFAGDIMKLILNCLLYLNYTDKDVKQQWMEGTPSRLLKQLHHGTNKERGRARRTLENNGFTRIHFCGESLQREYEASARIHGYEVSPHWRRGHWRNQAIGTGRQSHKLIWIQPTIVRRDLGEPTQGHIYEVGA